MLNFNLFENIIIKCFCGANKKEYPDELDKKIYEVSTKYKISILPISPNFDIDNLYPLTDHVELWNIFIVGNDKTYILANVNDIHITIPHAAELPNRQSSGILPEELIILFDNLWNKTLSGKQLQFYMVWNSKLYFVNTYPFFNGKRKVIGAILFMRAFDSMPEIMACPPRVSLERTTLKEQRHRRISGYMVDVSFFNPRISSPGQTPPNPAAKAYVENPMFTNGLDVPKSG